MTYPSPAPVILALMLASTTSCGDDAAAPIIDLGPRRQLLFITGATHTTSKHLGRKHGGAHGELDTVHVFDRATLERVGEIAFEGGAGDIHATPDGAVLWVVNPDGDTISLLDTDTYEMTSIALGAGPEHSFISPDHRQIWVGNDASLNVSVIDIASRTLVGNVLTGSGHHKVAFAEDDSGAVTFAYVSNIGDSSITPVTPEREALLNVSGVGAAPHGLDYGRGTHAIYNCSGDAMHSVEVVATRDDPETALNEQHTIVARIPLEERCRYIHVSDDGMFAHATSPKSNRFVRIDLTTHAVTTFETGGAPDTFEVVGGYAYVGNVSDPYVSVIDLTGSTSPAQIAVGNAVPPNEDEDGTRAMRLDGGHLFVANAYDGTVSVIDVTSNLVIATLTDISGAAGIAIAGPEGGTTFPR